MEWLHDFDAHLHVAQCAGVDGENIDSHTDQKTEYNRNERLGKCSKSCHRSTYYAYEDSPKQAD